MQALDNGPPESISTDTPAHHETSVTKNWHKVPEFHHAAAHKMFHYWSKLRVNLTIPNLEPLKFLQDVDAADKALFQQDFESHITAEIPISLVIQGIESMFENIMRLPFVLRHLFTYGGLTNETCLDYFRRYLDTSPGLDFSLSFKSQNAEELLLETVALKHLAGVRADHSLSQKADLCFRYALQHFLDMQAQQSPQTLPFKFLVVIILFYVYGRPFHALGLLQGFESLIHNCSQKVQEDL
jgi:hypothetical protein